MPRFAVVPVLEPLALVCDQELVWARRASGCAQELVWAQRASG